MSLFGDGFHITIKHLFEIISPIDPNSLMMFIELGLLPTPDDGDIMENTGMSIDIDDLT